MKKHSICFIIFMLLLSGFLGAVMGSLLETVFGLGYLNYEVLPNKGIEINNFYIVKRFNLQLTPATFIGIAIGIYYLYKSNN